jgi:hypothetical protein
MTDERSPPSALRGRLADVFVPALVSGAVDALSRRLGNRATIDDPLYGRASSLASIEPLLARVATYFADGQATYEHVCSTTGIDRDASEGRLVMTLGGETRSVPIAIVAERRRLREIELRVYYEAEATEGRKPRSPLLAVDAETPLANVIEDIVGGLRKGALERALAGFEEASRVVDSTGRAHAKQDGALGIYLAELGELDLQLAGAADDGRTACIEGTLVRRGSAPGPALFAFERGDSGLVRELRVY